MNECEREWVLLKEKEGRYAEMIAYEICVDACSSIDNGSVCLASSHRHPRSLHTIKQLTKVPSNGFLPKSGEG